ncbi:MAG: type transport system permease protein [Solirubrobacteraceae bacterium]|jgi:ABC-2 type transport system permease protein|nr:type transport system permease protein [Solirubrobacteraceae bacterium]
MGRAHARSIALAVAGRHLHIAVRSPSLLLPPLLFPVFLFAAFAGGLSGIGDARGFDYPDFKAFLFVFVVLQSAAFVGVFVGVALAADIQSGFVRRMIAAAPGRAPVLTGYLLASLARGALSTAALSALAFASGMQVSGGPADVAIVLVLAMTVTAAATLFAAGIALRWRTTQAAPLMQVPVFLAMFLAPVYTPRELMTGWVRTVADVNPATLLLETGRDLLAGAPAQVGLSFAATLGATVVLGAWAFLGLRRAESERA